MWSLVGAFIKKYAFEILLASLLVIAVLIGNHLGYKSGFKAGASSRDSEVTKLKGQIEARDKQEADRINTLNTRISDLERESTRLVGEAKRLQDQLKITQSTVITKYVDRYPQVANKCGWEPPTVDAIRELLEYKGEL